MSSDKINQRKKMNKKNICLKTMAYLAFLLISTLVIASENIEDYDGASSKKIKKEELQATIIHFSEYETGTGTYPVKMTVTADFLRVDDTNEGKDFVLFNRKEKVIYSVSSEEQQIIKIKYVPVTIKPPMEFKLHTVKMPTDKKAPSIAGKKPEHHQFYVNDKLCYDQVTVPGLMPDVVTALQNFKQVLAGQQAETIRYIPADVHESCDLVKHTFYPKLYLEKGFPIMEQEVEQIKGQDDKDAKIKYSRALVNFMQQSVLAELFVLPEYQVIEIN